MTARLRMADPVQTTPQNQLPQPDFFEVEVRLFQADVALSAGGGFFPLGNVPSHELAEEDQPLPA